MTRVEAIIRFDKMEEVMAALDGLGMKDMRVTGASNRHGRIQYHHEREFAGNLLRKIRLETVVPDDSVEPVVEAIIFHASTGDIGDGKIFLSNVDNNAHMKRRLSGCI